MRATVKRGARAGWVSLRDRRGVAMVEFALILPVMLLLYLGGVQLQDAMSCKRKVTITTRAAADLVAQNTTGTTTAAEIQANLIVAAQVMQPYAPATAQIRLTQITTDSRGRTFIIWSRGQNTYAYPKGIQVRVYPAMSAPGSSFLVAEVDYNYSPAATFGTFGPITLNDIIWMVPRNTDQITCSDC